MIYDDHGRPRSSIALQLGETVEDGGVKKIGVLDLNAIGFLKTIAIQARLTNEYLQEIVGDKITGADIED